MKKMISNTQGMILSILEVNGPLCGKAIVEFSNGDIKIGSVYVALNDLAYKGLVLSFGRSESKPITVRYKITSRGVCELSRWRESLRQYIGSR